MIVFCHVRGLYVDNNTKITERVLRCACVHARYGALSCDAARQRTVSGV